MARDLRELGTAREAPDPRRAVEPCPEVRLGDSPRPLRHAAPERRSTLRASTVAQRLGTPGGSRIIGYSKPSNGS